MPLARLRSKQGHAFLLGVINRSAGEPLAALPRG
jgi:hypothetical protein